MKDSWEKITIKDYLKINDIKDLQVKSNDEKDFMLGAYLNEMEYEDFISLPLSKTRDMMANMQFLYDTPKVPKRPQKVYTLNGRKYRLIRNAEDMTTAQFIDFQSLQDGKGYDAHVVEMMSVFLVPDGHAYNDGYDKEQVENDILELPLVEGLSIANFFMKRFTRLTQRFLIQLHLITKIASRTIKDKEQRKAFKLEMRLIQDELKRTLGLIA